MSRRVYARRAARVALLLALVLVLLGGRARAQRGVDAELFRPALDGYGIFSVERAQTAPQWDFGFKLYTTYAQAPLHLGLYDAGLMRPRSQAILEHQVALNLGAYLGLTSWLELAFDLPLSQQGYGAAFGANGSYAAQPLIRTGFYAADRYTNVGPPDVAPLDVRVALKARLFRAGPFGMALAASVTLPFGDEAAFLGDSGFTFRPTLIADVTRGRFTFAVNVGAIIRPETIVYAPDDPASYAAMFPRRRAIIDVGHELTWSAGAAYRFVRWMGIGAEAFGLVPLARAATQSFDAATDYTAEVLGGLQFFPGHDVAIAAGGGASVIPGALRHDDFRVFLGVSWAPVESGRVAAALGGIDSDGDGVPDGADLCPSEPEDKDGFDDEDGCPDLDNDQDGIPDAQDKCPNEPEDKDGFQDDDGCPDIDNDGDGIPDVQDKCPNEPEDKDGFQDDDGCPDLDNDGDGIPDKLDKCPNEPETRNGVDDEDGCPDSGGAVQIAGGRIELPEAVLFETGEAAIASRSQALLDRIAEKMKANPAVRRVRIEGHSDDVGSGRKNLELSQARAEAVRTALIARGIAPERLQAVGYGDTRPLDRRRNAEARAKNRRVELIIVEQ